MSNLSKISLVPRKRAKEIDPEKIFDGLTLRGGIENIWGPQTEALRLWHKERAKSRVVLE